MKRLASSVLGVALAIGFLALCFWNTDPAALWERMKAIDAALMLVTLALIPVHLAARALRWQTLLAEVRTRIPFKELYSAVGIGYMASLLPGRLGEVLRPVLLSRRTQIPLAPSIATVAVERIVLDALAVLSCGALWLILPPTLSGFDPALGAAELAQLRSIGGVALAVGMGLLGLLALLARRRERAAVWLTARARPHTARGAFLRWVSGMLPGLGAFATLRGLVRLALETAVLWGLIAVANLTALWACGISIPAGGVLILIPLLAIGIGIPAPGGTGPFHFALIFGLTRLFGVEPPAAQAAALVVHALTWLPVLMLGGGFIAWGGLKKGPAASASPAGGGGP